MKGRFSPRRLLGKLAIGSLLVAGACHRRLEVGYLDDATGGASGNPGAGTGAARGNGGSSAGTVPTRLIVVTFPLGFLDAAFRPTFPDPPAKPEAAWERSLTDDGVAWGPILTPLIDLRNDVTVVDGLAVHVILHDLPGRGLPCVPRCVTSEDILRVTLTGHVSPDFNDYGPSLDYLVGSAITPVGKPPVVVSGQATFLSFDEQGPMPVGWDPDETYASNLRELADQNAPCLVAGPPRAVQPTDSTRSLDSWWERSRPNISNLVSCDVTRVISLHVPLASASELGFANNLDVDKDLADKVFTQDVTGDEARAGLARYGRLQVSEVADLARSLKLTRVSDGSSLLDHTLIVLVGREAHPGHIPYPWHMVMIGGRGLGLQTARYLHVAQQFQTIDIQLGGSTNIGGPHNWALVSIARLFGLDIDSIGDTEVALRGGSTVDLTGTVPGLLP